MATNMSAEVEREEQPKAKINPLPPGNLTFLDQRSVAHVAVIPRGTPVEALAESSFWTSVAHRLQNLDTIRCIYEDRSMIVELIVLEASPIWTATHILGVHQLPGIISDGSDELTNFEVFYSVTDLYCVRRLSDSVMLVKNASSKEKAIDELKAHAAFAGSK